MTEKPSKRRPQRAPLTQEEARGKGPREGGLSRGQSGTSRGPAGARRPSWAASLGLTSLHGASGSPSRPGGRPGSQKSKEWPPQAQEGRSWAESATAPCRGCSASLPAFAWSETSPGAVTTPPRTSGPPRLGGTLPWPLSQPTAP